VLWSDATTLQIAPQDRDGLASQRNIVPLMLEGIDFGTPKITSQLTGTQHPAEYFLEAMGRLRDRFPARKKS